VRKIKLTFAAAALCTGLAASSVSAMPIAPITTTATNLEQVYWVCGRYGRCWWQPGYYYGWGAPYGYYGYGRPYYSRRYYWRHYSWRRHYSRHHHW